MSAGCVGAVMAEEETKGGRRIVTCDGCGTPFAALEATDGLVLIGDGGGECPNCSGTAFSTISL